MKNNISLLNIIKINIFFIFIIACVQLVYIGLNVYFTDSEIWALTLSQDLFKLKDESFGVYHKPLFHFLIYNLSFLTSDNVKIYFYARIVSIFFSFFTIYQVYKISKVYFRSSTYMMLSLSMLLSTYYFISWYPTVRSDSYATPFLLASFYQLIKSEKVNLKKYIIYQILAVLMTPKSIFFCAFQWFVLAPQNIKINSLNKKKVILSSTFLLVLFTIYLFMFKHSLVYFLNYFNYDNLLPSYLSTDSFVYLLRFIRDDILIFVLFFLSLIFFFIKNKRDPVYRKLGIYTFWVIILVLFYPLKLPYFISAQIPLIAIFISANIYWLYNKYRNKYDILLAFVCYVFMIFLIFNHIRLYQDLRIYNNSEQIRTINILQEKMPTDLTYYDCIGLLPFRDPILAYLGPNQSLYNEVNVNMVKSKKPDIILAVGRVLITDKKFRGWILDNYSNLGAGFFVNNKIESAETLINLKSLAEEIGYDLAYLFQFDIFSSNYKIKH